MPRPRSIRILAVVGSLTVAAILGVAALSLSTEPGGLTGRVEATMDRSGVGNPVTAVLLNFRAYDTWLEVGVLLLAVLGVIVLRGAPGPGPVPAEPSPDERLHLLWLVRLLVPVLLLAAAHVLLTGTGAPGGAFQAGALLGSAAVLLTLNGTGTIERMSLIALRSAWLAGFGAFLLLAVATLSAGRRMLELPGASAALLILIIETAVTIAIGASLASLFVGARSGGDGA
jgi:multisubunit Na+/H+ antiporter MnhB subunit